MIRSGEFAHHSIRYHINFKTHDLWSIQNVSFRVLPHVNRYRGRMRVVDENGGYPSTIGNGHRSYAMNSWVAIMTRTKIGEPRVRLAGPPLGQPCARFIFYHVSIPPPRTLNPPLCADRLRPDVRIQALPCYDLRSKESPCSSRQPRSATSTISLRHRRHCQFASISISNSKFQ
jgi:hypothetical protein